MDSARRRSRRSARPARWPGRAPRERRRLMVFGRLAAARTDAAGLGGAGDHRRATRSRIPVAAAAAATRQRSPLVGAVLRRHPSRRRQFACAGSGLTLVALVGLVLVVACTNLANLVLARGTARQGELAVRMAMGASRGRLIWEQCIESVLLAAAGAVASYVMFQARVRDDDHRLRDGLPFGGAATLSIRPSLNGSAVIVVAMVDAARARRLRSRAGRAAGAHARHPQRAGRRRHRHPAARRPPADGDSLAGRHRRRLLHRRHDVHSRARSTRPRTITGVELDRLAVATLNFDNGVWDEAPHPPRDRSRHRGRPRAIGDRADRGVDGPAVRRAAGDAGHDRVARSTSSDLNLPPIARRRRHAVVLPGRSASRSCAAAPSTTATAGGHAGRSSSASSRRGQMFGSIDVVGRPLADAAAARASRWREVVGVARDTDVRVDLHRSAPADLPAAGAAVRRAASR